MQSVIELYHLSGVAAIPLHWFGIAREHFESQWKRYSSMVHTLISLLYIDPVMGFFL